MTIPGGGRSTGPDEAGSLTDLQRKFAAAYAVFPNGTRAALAAGYSEKSAAQSGSDNIRLPHVWAEIERLRAEGLQNAPEITPARTLRELAAIAYADASEVAQVLDGYAFIADTCHLPKHLRCAIASIGRTKNGLQVKMHDKVAALRMLAEIQRLFKPEGSERVAPPIVINGVLLDEPTVAELQALPAEISTPALDPLELMRARPDPTPAPTAEYKPEYKLPGNVVAAIEPPRGAAAARQAAGAAPLLDDIFRPLPTVPL